MEKIELSIITVNYNGMADTIEMIESVQRLSFPFLYELIVVDNASRKDEVTIIEEKFPFIKAVRSIENLGFAGGNNLGIKQAKGEYLYFLNNDTLLNENSVGEILEMIAFLRQNPMVGGISPKIMFYDPKNWIQFAGVTPLSRITLRNRQVGYKEVDHGQYNKLEKITYLHGAAMMLPRKIVDEIGNIPECYFLYYEEVDWSEMIRKKYDLYYFPQAMIVHKESASTGVDSPLKIYYLTRNRLIFSFRQQTGIIRIFSILYQFLVAAPTHYVIFIVSGKKEQAFAIVKGLGGFFQFLLQKK